MVRLGLAVVATAILSAIGPVNAADEPTSSGTGFLINADGWLVTNAHVVTECAKVTVADHGEVSSWKIDAQNDLATARLPGLEGEPIPIRKTPARLGEDIATLGYPLANLLSSSVKVTTGNVNALLGLGDDTRYLQISAPVQPGNSGGPVVDRSGALLGITSAVLKPGSDGFVPQNVNFAIRSSVLELFLQSRGIEYPSVDAIGQALDTADLAEKTARGTFQLLCHPLAPAPGPPADAVDTPPESVSVRALEFAVAYHVAWSQPNPVALAVMDNAYADQVDFYGKSVGARAVLDEKRRFAKRWPYRSYTIRPGTSSASCSGSVCRVSALVDWFASSLTRSSSGVASFDLVVDTERGRIISEAGAVRKGEAASADHLVRVWGDFNSRCRGGAGDNKSTWDACTVREQLSSRLVTADWCYGRAGEAGYQHLWHRCGPDSMRN